MDGRRCGHDMMMIHDKSCFNDIVHIYFLIWINDRDSCDGQRDSRDIMRININ